MVVFCIAAENLFLFFYLFQWSSMDLRLISLSIKQKEINVDNKLTIVGGRCMFQ